MTTIPTQTPEHIAKDVVAILDSKCIYSSLDGGRSRFGFSYYVTVRKTWDVSSDDYFYKAYTVRISDHYANMSYRCQQYNMGLSDPEYIVEFLIKKLNK